MTIGQPNHQAPELKTPREGLVQYTDSFGDTLTVSRYSNGELSVRGVQPETATRKHRSSVIKVDKDDVLALIEALRAFVPKKPKKCKKCDGKGAV